MSETAHALHDKIKAGGTILFEAVNGGGKADLHAWDLPLICLPPPSPR